MKLSTLLLRRRMMMQGMPYTELQFVQNSQAKAYIRIEDIPLDSTCGIKIEFQPLGTSYISAMSSLDWQKAGIRGVVPRGEFVDYGFQILFKWSSVEETKARKTVYYNYMNDGKVRVTSEGYTDIEVNVRKRFNTDVWLLFAVIINNSLNWVQPTKIFGRIEITKGMDVYKVLIPVLVNGEACYMDSEDYTKLYRNSGDDGYLFGE